MLLYWYWYLSFLDYFSSKYTSSEFMSCGNLPTTLCLLRCNGTIYCYAILFRYFVWAQNQNVLPFDMSNSALGCRFTKKKIKKITLNGYICYVRLKYDNVALYQFINKKIYRHKCRRNTAINGRRNMLTTLDVVKTVKFAAKYNRSEANNNNNNCHFNILSNCVVHLGFITPFSKRRAYIVFCNLIDFNKHIIIVLYLAVVNDIGKF